MSDATTQERVDFWNLLIQRRRGVPEGWRWFSIQGKGHPAPREQCVALITGAVCTAVFMSGPRKGETNWAKRDKSTEREVAIPLPEFDAFLLEWEKETGRCHGCQGSGQELAGWSADGVRMRTCSQCGGTGKPKEKP